MMQTGVQQNGQVQARDPLDRRVAAGLKLLALLCAGLLFLILGFLIFEASPVLSLNWLTRFVQDTAWFPLDEAYGMLPMIIGSLAACVLAVLIAIPFALSFAITQYFLAPPLLARSLRLLINILAGLPSVIFGLWGLTTLVPLIAQWQAPGSSLLAASIVLALMILPTIALTTLSAFQHLPVSLLQGSAALALSRRTCVVRLVLPLCRPAVVSGIVLASARALGETMAVLMVAGNVVQIPSSVFDPVRVLTANIALEMGYALDTHRASLFVSGLFLCLLVLALTHLGRRSEIEHHEAWRQ